MKTTDFINENFIADAAAAHQDHEVQMARGDCYNAAKYAVELHKLLKNISEQEGLDGWVSEKITLANDYLRTVTEYLRYEQQSDSSGMDEFNPVSATQTLDAALGESAPTRKPAVVKTNKPIGTRVADIGPGGKEYNVKTNKAWDDQHKKEPGVVEGKADPVGSWVVYDGSKVKRFKSRDGAKAYAEKNGGKVASSEHYADKIQKQEVDEDMSRRGFLKGLGAVAAGAALGGAKDAEAHWTGPYKQTDKMTDVETTTWANNSTDGSAMLFLKHDKPNGYHPVIMANNFKFQRPANDVAPYGRLRIDKGPVIPVLFGYYADSNSGVMIIADFNNPGPYPRLGDLIANAKKEVLVDVGAISSKGILEFPIDKISESVNQGVAEGEQGMSRAAKGHEKYGKEGMQALAKAGREGASEKELDAIRDKHDRYDESVGGMGAASVATSMGGGNGFANGGPGTIARPKMKKKK